MAQEIERKFFVNGDFKKDVEGCTRIIQGYISSDPERTVRIRIRNEKAYITIKGKSEDNGLVRYEWEKEISLPEAIELLKICEPGIIDKYRYLVPVGDHTFEVDEFHGDNEGLIVAEVELRSKDDLVEETPWLGDEVTGDFRYYNSRLSKHPYKDW